MKLKIVVALSALFALSMVSPRAHAQGAANLNPENMRAIALIGSSYNDFLKSSGYRGHLILTKVTFKAGTGTVAKVLDWKSTWQNAGDGQFSKRSTDALFTETKGSVTTTEKFNGVDDGLTTKRNYTNRQMWSERPPIKEYDVSITFARAPLQMAILFASQGANLEMVEEKRDAKDVRVIRAGTALEIVLDAKTNAMKSWKADKKDGEVSSCVWLSQELNPVFKADDWAFKVPPTAKKVPADAVNLQLDF